jgi:NDP-sugar pyrophosphorylase family protein
MKSRCTDGPMPSVCVLAGGLGTRLGELTATTPKPLIEVAGSPFLDHQLSLLSTQGVRRAVLCVGYLGEQIEHTLGPKRFGITLSYSYDKPGLDGTLGAIRRALPLLDDRFLYFYGDAYLRIDCRVAFERWKASGLLGMMAIFRNRGHLDVSNAEFDGQLVTKYDKRHPTPEMEWIDFGMGGLSHAAVEGTSAADTDLAELHSALASQRQLLGIESTERFYEIGSPRALAETEAYLASKQ